MTTDIAYETVPFTINGEKIEIYSSPNSFRPNRVSDGFVRGLPSNLTGKIAYDIGAGSGIISIAEAMKGSRIVYAVEPADANYELLLKNIRKLGLEKTIIPYQGKYFDPLTEVEKADIITADVSGIPDTFGRALDWYPEGIDTGGKEGYEITCELLRRAPRHIKPTGMLLFPTANDLLDYEKILEVARRSFSKVENALCTEEQLETFRREASKSDGRIWKSPDYVWFQLRDQDLDTLCEAYAVQSVEELPKTINIQRVKGRSFWRGQIHKATNPMI